MDENPTFSIIYVLKGDPIPLARARFGRGRCWDAQKELKNYIGITIESQHNKRPQYSGPVLLNITFFMQKPKSLKKIPKYYPYRPDLSNLVKFVEDVATGILYKDDCIIASIHAEKKYDRIPRTEFFICPLE